MPYITQDDRVRLDINGDPISTPGELNYAITKLLDKYLITKGLTYTHINDCLGALQGASMEFYRRVAVSFEEGKMKVNGDVYSAENLTNV